MYTIWYSTEDFADYVIANTVLSEKVFTRCKIYESDANNSQNFHKMPDHIKQILYLDAPDLIIEKDSEPIFSVEVSSEAGTGHNVFQRFARLAASVENDVPAFYIYPEASIVQRQNRTGWDRLNPLIFKAFESVMNIYDIPALLYYFPSDFREYPTAAEAPNGRSRGLRYDEVYPSCPDSRSDEMQRMFEAMNQVLSSVEEKGFADGRLALLRNLTIRERREYMGSESNRLRVSDTSSPISATVKVKTKVFLELLRQQSGSNYEFVGLLTGRDETLIYCVNAIFRGDPYPGALAALDYMLCREGKTFEDRRFNLVLLWGKLSGNLHTGPLHVADEKGSTINGFVEAVKKSERLNLLSKEYAEIASSSIPRYYMQVRYGSSFSKVKHVRVFSYFADAIIFPDGALWRDA